MTLKEELAEVKAENENLTGQIKEAAEKISRLESEAKSSEQTIVDLNAELKKAQDDKKENKDDGDPEDKKDGGDDEDKEKEKNKKAKAELVALTERAEAAEFNLKSANARIKELEGEKVSVEQLAETKAREIAARNGGNLPAKQPRAGDKQTEKDPKTGSWRERLSGFWQPIDI